MCSLFSWFFVLNVTAQTQITTSPYIRCVQERLKLIQAAESLSSATIPLKTCKNKILQASQCCANGVGVTQSTNQKCRITPQQTTPSSNNQNMNELDKKMKQDATAAIEANLKNIEICNEELIAIATDSCNSPEPSVMNSTATYGAAHGALAACLVGGREVKMIEELRTLGQELFDRTSDPAVDAPKASP